MNEGLTWTPPRTPHSHTTQSAPLEVSQVLPLPHAHSDQSPNPLNPTSSILLGSVQFSPYHSLNPTFSGHYAGFLSRCPQSPPAIYPSHCHHGQPVDRCLLFSSIQSNFSPYAQLQKGARDPGLQLPSLRTLHRLAIETGSGVGMDLS